LPRKGKSHSRRPVNKRTPSWCKYSPEEVEAYVVKLAKEGVPPSQISVILRDQQGIPLVKSIVGKSITKILADNNLTLPIPEDITNLINKTNRLERHLTKNKADTTNKHSLELLVSKTRRLAKYYKKNHVLPENWKFKSEIFVT